MARESSSDEMCAAAAVAIHDASFLLVTAGAGFTADSGMPWGGRLSAPALRERGVGYDDLCRERLRREDPALFFGFWGHYLNASRRTQPNEGYAIIQRWCARAAANSGAARAATIASVAEEGAVWLGETNWPPSHYIYTSNHDGHFMRAGFDTSLLHELHGSTERWLQLPGVACQCAVADGEAPASAMWRVPAGFVFSVDDESMRAVPGAAAELVAGLLPPAAGMGEGEELQRPDVSGLRPAVLMFGEGHRVHGALGLRASGARYQAWEEQVEATVAGEGLPVAVATALSARGALPRLVVLELGCGLRVPNVRIESEEVLCDTNNRAAAADATRGSACSGPRATLIRINLEYPLNPSNQDATISIRSNGLAALQEIDRRLAALDSRDVAHQGR